MKLRAILLSAFAFCSLTTTAQTWITDSVTMGAAQAPPFYPNDVFYSLKNGIQKIQTNDDWTIAFQTTVFGSPSFNATARVNHAQNIALFPLHMQASTSFTTITAADTIGKTSLSMQLINNDTSWGTGAFYQNRNAGDPFDFGYAEYAGSPTHAVIGKDSVYLIKTPGGAYKFQFIKYVSTPADSVSYAFRIANLDGSNDKTIKFYRKPGFTDRLFAYYKAGNNNVTDREPSSGAWDILFTRYASIIPNGQGGIMYQAYTGVLNNEGLQVAEVHNVAADTAHYQNYTRTRLTNEIGDDWKHFNQGAGIYTVDTTFFFIKAVSSNEYYQLQFTRFDGSSTGKTVFRKRGVGATAVYNVAAQNVATWAVSPNPATDKVAIMVDAKEGAADTKLVVMDAAGKVVLQTATPLQKGMNAYSFSAAAMPSGIYFVRIGNSAWSVAQRLVVAH